MRKSAISAESNVRASLQVLIKDPRRHHKEAREIAPRRFLDRIKWLNIFSAHLAHRSSILADLSRLRLGATAGALIAADPFTMQRIMMTLRYLLAQVTMLRLASAPNAERTQGGAPHCGSHARKAVAMPTSANAPQPPPTGQYTIDASKSTITRSE